MLKRNGIIFSLVMAAAVLLSSCKKWVDVEAPLQVDQNQLFSTEQGFRDVLNGVYLQMGSRSLYGRDLGLGLLSVLLPVRQVAHAQGITPRDFVAPAVFQAAGTTASSIQSTVDAFRIARSRAVIARSTGTAGTPPTWPRRSAGTRSMAVWSLAARFSPRTAPRSSRLRPRD